GWKRRSGRWSTCASCRAWRACGTHGGSVERDPPYDLRRAVGTGRVDSVFPVHPRADTARPRYPHGDSIRTLRIVAKGLVQLRRAVHGDLQVLDQPVLQPVDPAMHRHRLPPLPGALHDGRVADVAYLALHVQLAEQVDRLLLVQPGEAFQVLVVQRLEGAQ